MTQKILYLFPDTNLFIHGLALDEIGWQVLAEFDEVHLVVSRPTQKEIDKHKNKGGERLARRARKASSLFREVIANGGQKVVRTASPCVKVMLRVDLRHDPALTDRLNYEEPDDQLVGIVHAFRQQNPGAEVRVLTDDTGPMASAQMVGVPVLPIPDDWLKRPEASDEEKKVRALEAEIARLRTNEPSFQIVFVDDEGNKLEALECEFVRYQALTKAELDNLMQRIKTRFPMATDFGSREPAEREARLAGFAFAGGKQVFTPATEEEIAAYRDEHYPQWLEMCENILRSCHELIQQQSGPTSFCVVVGNEGTRPAKDALMTIEAKGHFKIKPPAYRDEDDEEQEEQQNAKKPLELLRPPSPPRGTWKSARSPYSDPFGSVASLQQALAGLTPGRMDFLRPEIHMPIIRDYANTRDPNEFYYKPNRPMLPQSSFSLECEQWRHGIDDHSFTGEIYFKDDRETISGVLDCRIDAENLSDPAVESIPVRIQVKRISIHEIAEKLVEALTNPGGQSKFSGLGL